MNKLGEYIRKAWSLATSSPGAFALGVLIGWMLAKFF